MKKNIVIYLSIILLSSLLLTGCTKNEQEEVVDPEQEMVDEQESEEEKEKDLELGYLESPDDFTKTKQVLGEVSEYEYTLESIEESKGEGYHEFLFTLSSTTLEATTPLFTVEPMLDKGLIKVTISNVFSDSTGLTHQEGILVDLGAISGIYRSITSLENTRIYDIGILANNPFKLDLQSSEEGKWVFSVKVAYDNQYTPPTLDLGSEEFSSEVQSIEGVTSREGAKVTSYSYSVSGSVLKFTFVVGSGASNPIPSVNAAYDGEGLLNVTFESLESDKVSTWGNEISLPSGVKVFVSRKAESSLYRFGGISGTKPFKLSATQGPNQVIVEIQL